MEDISDDEIAGMNIPTGVPLVYHLNEDFTVDHVGYLGDEEIIRAKIDAVKCSLFVRKKRSKFYGIKAV